MSWKEKVVLGLTVLLVAPSLSAAQPNPFDADPTGSANAFDETSAPSVKLRPAHASVLRTNDDIYRRLELPAQADFFEDRFADVVDSLGTDFLIRIVIDGSARKNQLDEDTLITLSMAGIPLRSLLTVMLQPYECTYQVAGDVLLIVAKDSVHEFYETRVFDCKSLIQQSGEGGVEKLINVVQASVEPKTWDVQGGHATISEIGGLLVVSQSSVLQLEIQQLLDELSERLAN